MSGGELEGLFLYQVPAPLMFSFYDIMDSLDDSGWRKFASMIISDQTALRLLEKPGRQRNRTEAVMWHWMNRNARVGELLSILHQLSLFRALGLFESWSLERQSHLPPAEKPLPVRTPTPPPPYARSGSDHSQLEKRRPSLSPSQAETEYSKASPLPLPGPPPPHLMCSSISASRRSCSGSSTSSSSSIAHSSVQESFPSVSLIEPARHLMWNFQEVVEGTKNFSPSLLVGEGGFGCVYKATIRNTEYAVKRLKQDSELEWSTVKKSFLTEIEKLTSIRHPNIIDLAGYCIQGEEYCLIYLFLPNGSLEDRLHLQGSFPTLSWKQRLGVMQGAACGIQFLHACQPSIIHGDIKSSNILLDQALLPKLGDFGLSRFSRYTCDAGKSRTVARTSTVRGTLAYLPDEYVKLGKLTFQLDTYSFGVVLLEILTGRKAIDEINTQTTYLKDLVNEEEGDQESACSPAQGATTVLEHKQARTASRICHHHLDLRPGICPLEVAQGLSLLACRCLGRQRKRPSMVEVFEEIKRLQNLLASMEVRRESGDLQGFVSDTSDDFPPVLDLLSSLKSSVLIPQENTYKFPPCGPQGTMPSRGGVQPYSPCSGDKPSSLCSLSSCQSHRTEFRRTRNLPVESDESGPFFPSTSSEEHEYGLVRQPCGPSPGRALQCRSTAQPAASQTHSLNTEARHSDSYSPVQGGSLPSVASQALSVPHPKIVMNPAKQRFVEQLALYDQGKINSLELLYSGSAPVTDFISKNKHKLARSLSRS
ncbi:interleukin-1 receptor-associated kinase 1 [Gastrophryne carolinensis]